MNIWLDDIRLVPEGWVHIHNFDELELLVKDLGEKLDIHIMSFDYHLDHPKKGIDVMKYLADLCVQHNTTRYWPNEVRYHTNDPKGEEEMRAFAESLRLVDGL